VLAVGETEIEFPVPAGVPPQEPVYHSAVAPVPAVPPLKVNVVYAPEQIVVVPVIEVGATLLALTVNTTLSDVAGQEPAAGKLYETVTVVAVATFAAVYVDPVIEPPPLTTLQVPPEGVPVSGLVPPPQMVVVAVALSATSQLTELNFAIN